MSRLPIDVWLYGAGRIRRAILRRDRIVMTLELSDFGGPDPIELPPPEEIVRRGMTSGTCRSERVS